MPRSVARWVHCTAPDSGERRTPILERGHVSRSGILSIALAMMLAIPALAEAQGSPPPATATSRADLEARAAKLEQEAATAGKADDRTRKSAEAAAIRTRLRDGDFRVGDRIVVKVDSGVAAQPDSFIVRDGRMVEFPGIPPISLDGVLHSELSDYLTAQLSRYFRNPTVQAYPLLRVAIMGAVGAPGFYSLPADVLVSDAIMRAGGPSQGAKLEETVVKRGEREVVDKREMQRAIVYGYTLAQVNLRDGDAIHVGGGTQRNWTETLRAVSLGIGLAFTIYQISKQF